MSRRRAGSSRHDPGAPAARPHLAAAVAVALAVAAGVPGGGPTVAPETPSPAGRAAAGAPQADTGVSTARPATDGPASVAGQDPGSSRRQELDALTAEVASQLRCPVCRNQSVLESSAELSQKMQSVIRARLAAGQSPEEVKAYFVDRYGEWILLRPRARGINLLVYVLPGLALLAGAFLVWRLLRRWSTPGSGAEARADRGGEPGEGPPPLDPEEERELEAVLDEGRR